MPSLRNLSPPPTSHCSITDDRPHIPIVILNRTYEALIDTGAAASLIGDEIARRCEEAGLSQQHVTNEIVVVANGRTVKIPSAYKILIENPRFHLIVYMSYLPGLVEDVVLGMDLLRYIGVKLDLSTNSIMIPQGHSLKPSSPFQDEEDHLLPSPKQSPEPLSRTPSPFLKPQDIDLLPPSQSKPTPNLHWSKDRLARLILAERDVNKWPPEALAAAMALRPPGTRKRYHLLLFTSSGERARIWLRKG